MCHLFRFKATCRLGTFRVARRGSFLSF
uniref:Uncharacterized protein n=1 Tax=Arundo donax TaxID=35708 RepID=A0A0A9B713_ARUDO